MKKATKSVLRQILPPFVVELGKKFRGQGNGSGSAPDLEHSETVAALRLEHERRNRGTPENEIVFRDGLAFKVHPESRLSVEYFCFLDPVMVAEMDCFLDLTKDRHRLLDVGALHGVFSLAFAARDPANQAVAIDASPLAFGRLLYNVHKNKFHNVTPLEYAVSDSPGTLHMHYEWEHAIAAEIEGPDYKYLEVAKTTGDDLCASLAFAPDVVKVDVEGHEVKVVKGLATTIQRQRPLVFLELHPSRIRVEQDRVDDLAGIFENAGYTSRLIDGTAVGLRDIAKFVEDQRLVLTPA